MGKAKRERVLPDNEALAKAHMMKVSAQKLNLVASLIRGKKGTKVRLDILPAESGVDAKPELVVIERDKVNVKMDRGNDVSMLEVEVELPLKDADGNNLRLAANA